MKHISILLLGVLLFSIGCTDEDKDPLLFEQIKKGSILALRGQAVTNLNDISFRGSVAKFSLSGDPATQNFEFEADFLSDDLTSLDKVDLYARATETGPRERVGTVNGSEFAIPQDENYPRKAFSIPLNTILSATGKTLGSIAVNDYLFVECDLTLKDGTVVPASAIVNSSLFESAIFYPAHKLRYLAVQ